MRFRLRTLLIVLAVASVALGLAVATVDASTWPLKPKIPPIFIGVTFIVFGYVLARTATRAQFKSASPD